MSNEQTKYISEKYVNIRLKKALYVRIKIQILFGGNFEHSWKFQNREMVFTKQNLQVRNMRMVYQRGMGGLSTKGYTAVIIWLVKSQPCTWCSNGESRRVQNQRWLSLFSSPLANCLIHGGLIISLGVFPTTQINRLYSANFLASNSSTDESAQHILCNKQIFTY